MTRPSDLTATKWRKGSRSQNGADNCVAVACFGAMFAVHDSKNPDGPILEFPRDAFSAFLRNTIRNG